MLMDKNLIFADGAALRVSVAIQELTNTIDFGVADPNMGYGVPLYATLLVYTSMVGTTLTTYTSAIEDSSNGTAWNALIQTSVSAALDSGTVNAETVLINQPIPMEHERYVRATVTIAAQSLATAGAISAWLSKSAMYIKA